MELPAHWLGHVDWRLVVVGKGGDEAITSVTTALGESVVATFTQKDIRAEQGAMRLFVQWSDGSVCDSGIWCSGVDRAGNSVSMKAQKIGPGLYKCVCDEAPESIRIAPKDSFAGFASNLRLETNGVWPPSVTPVTFPVGAIVRVVLPDSAPTNVMVIGDFGARILVMSGQQELRAVPSGLIKASCQRNGVEWAAEIHVAGPGYYDLHLLPRDK